MKLCKETMIRSYSNISFSPERRGESDYVYYTELLASDLKLLGEHTGNYEKKFIQRVMLIYYRQSRCASVMITGSGNFPFRQNNKRNESQRRAEDDFTSWRNRYIKAATRERTLSPEEEIDKTLKEIDYLESLLIAIKEANKKTTKEERLAVMQEHSMQNSKYYGYFDSGFTVSTTNTATKLRERKKKLEVMKARIERKETFGAIAFNGGAIFIENDRVVIAHDSKPSKIVIEALKTNGFRYSPKFNNWCRKHTGNAIHAVKNLLNLLNSEGVM